MKSWLFKVGLVSQAFLSLGYGLSNAQPFDWKDHSELVKMRSGKGKCLGVLVGPKVVMFMSGCFFPGETEFEFFDGTKSAGDPHYMTITSGPLLLGMTVLDSPPKKAKNAYLGVRPFEGQTVTLVASANEKPQSDDSFGSGLARLVIVDEGGMLAKGKTASRNGDCGGYAMNRFGQLVGMIYAGDMMTRTTLARVDEPGTIPSLQLWAKGEEVEICGITSHCDATVANVSSSDPK